MTETLKSCPFCGSSDIRTYKSPRTPQEESYVFCNCCSANVPSNEGATGSDYLKEAIRLWNRRVSNG
jgi:Lar family restriction alleviation protein